MGVTSILTPTANAAVGTGIGDGITYGAWSNPQRIHRTTTGSSAAVATAANKGTVWTGCFDASQIPSGAVITGVELVAGTDPDGTGNSNIGNAGSTGASESMTYQMYLYNGTSYSSPLTFLSTPSGGSLNGDSTELTLTGSNKRYVNTTAGDDIMAGSSSSLSGLSWDPADQANFGFAITSIAVSATPVGIVVRGIGLRVTYSVQFPDKVIGEPPADILKVLGIGTANLANIAQPGNTTEPTPYQLFYQFESETPVTNTSDWSPGNSWVNGSSAVDGTYWGRDSNKTVKGWNLDTGTTPSTGSGTGPSDGVDVSDGSHASGTKYMYTEVSSSRYTRCFVARMPVFNSSNMLDSGNDLDLKFWVHAYGSQMGDLYVYIYTATTANHSSATELAAYESFSGYTSQSSVWQQKTISLNSYRNGADYYIYFVSQNATNFRGDLAVDAVQIIES
tara:strand:+ start:468 stop:1814 length:1347 start_codon:yes stop_codon:yes gene_type:complete